MPRYSQSELDRSDFEARDPGPIHERPERDEDAGRCKECFALPGYCEHAEEDKQ